MHSHETIASLHHNDSETPVPLKMLHPYTYEGCWPTTCKLNVPCLQNLTFVVNKEWANVSLTLETIHPLPHDESPESTADGYLNTEWSEPISNNTNHLAGRSHSFVTSEKHSPSSKMLMGNFTVLYVVSGQIHVLQHNGSQFASLEKGQTWVCERLDNSLPADISMFLCNPECEHHVSFPQGKFMF